MITFCMSSGKSGTMYLFHMLNLLKNCFVIHEDRFIFSFGKPLRKLNAKGDSFLAEKAWFFKLGVLYERLVLNGRVKNYIETDNIFLRIWSDFAARDLELGRWKHTFGELKIIDLKRNYAKVVRSFYRFGYFRKGWIIRAQIIPEDKSNLTEIKKDHTNLDRVLWYVFEIEERKKNFRKKYPNIPVFEFNLENKNDLVIWEKLADFLGLELNERIINEIAEDPIINSWEERWYLYKDISINEISDAINEYEILVKGVNA